jgi:hypothetical protein
MNCLVVRGRVRCYLLMNYLVVMVLLAAMLVQCPTSGESKIVWRDP